MRSGGLRARSTMSALAATVVLGAGLVSAPGPASAITLSRAKVTGAAFSHVTAGGAYHSCGLDAGGRGWCWGQDGSGQLGDGPADQADRYAPVPVAGDRVYTTISAGWMHTCALDVAGKAWCWGQDEAGQLGDGSADQSDKPAPVAVAGDQAYVAISAGIAHTCALDAAGGAWCWGRDETGQAGDGPADQSNKSAPVAVAGAGTYTAISAGLGHTCALNTAGKAWCWGRDISGEVGDGPTDQADKYSPVPVADDRTYAVISVGNSHTCALDTAGKAWCWGENALIQLGPNGPIRRFSPEAVPGDHKFQQISAGSSHTCALAAGKAWCWGWDSSGQVGDGPADQIDKVAPVRVSGRHTFTEISAGVAHTCAIAAAGTAWCWGLDRNGQVGDGPRRQANKYSPVPVGSSVSVQAVSHKGKLHVNVNPNLTSGNWTFLVQQKQSDGTWLTRRKTYRTKGAGEKRTLNFRRGTYRVVLPAQLGYRDVVSAAIHLHK